MIRNFKEDSNGIPCDYILNNTCDDKVFKQQELADQKETPNSAFVSYGVSFPINFVELNI